VLYIKIIYYYILKCEFTIITVNSDIIFFFTKLDTAFLIQCICRCPVQVQVYAASSVIDLTTSK
jgi:hypothetical protein